MQIKAILVAWISVGGALLLGVLYIISAFYQAKFEKPTPGDLFLVAAALVIIGGIGLALDLGNIWPMLMATIGALISLFAGLRLYNIMMR